MANYIYPRVWSNGKWNINNPDDVDFEGKSVTLAQRIKENGIIGDYLVKVCLNSNATVEMSQTLTPSEKDTLDTIVSTHENASGTYNFTSYIFLTSANGTQYRVYVDDLGNLLTESV